MMLKQREFTPESGTVDTYGVNTEWNVALNVCRGDTNHLTLCTNPILLKQHPLCKHAIQLYIIVQSQTNIKDNISPTYENAKILWK